MRIDEINTRLSAIADELKADDADLDALEAEIRSLQTEKAEIEEAVEKRQKLLDEAAKFIPEKIEKMEDEEVEERKYTVESAEYRNAWLKKLAGMEMNEVEERAYAASDANNAIPTLVADRMFEKMVKLAPMLSEITLMRVAGNIKFVAEGTRNPAAKHTENSAITAAADTIVTVTLGGFEFMKVIGISKAADIKSVDAFERWLVDMLAGDIARAIDDYILNDSSNGIAAITYTTGTNQILQTQGYTYADIVSLIALIPAAYDPEAKFLVNKATLYNSIANIVNSAGNPIFVPDTTVGVAGRLMGYPVVVDDYVSTSDDALYLGKWTDVVGNLSDGVNVERDESSGFLSGTINYRGYALFDSKPAKIDAIARLVATA